MHWGTPRIFQPDPGVGCRVWTGSGRGSSAQRGVPVDPPAQSRAPFTVRRAHGEPRRVRPAPRALPAAARLLLRNAPVAFWSGHVHRCHHAVSRQHQDEQYLHHFNKRGPAGRPGLPSALPVSANHRVRLQVLRGCVDPRHHPLHPGDYRSSQQPERLHQHTVLRESNSPHFLANTGVRTGDISINSAGGQHRLHGRGHSRAEEASQHRRRQSQQQNERDTDFCSQHVGVYNIFPAVYYTTLIERHGCLPRGGFTNAHLPGECQLLSGPARLLFLPGLLPAGQGEKTNGYGNAFSQQDDGKVVTQNF